MMIATGIQAQGVMDVHSHIITSEFVSALEQEVRLMDEGFPLPKYDEQIMGSVLVIIFQFLYNPKGYTR